jgi:predicted DNA-binding transcriptional regulator AlpA
MRQSQARALKIRDVEAITKLTASTIRRLERKGKFPKEGAWEGVCFGWQTRSRTSWNPGQR